jgi:hypothetical protein
LSKLQSLCITAPGAEWGNEDLEEDGWRLFDEAALELAALQFPGCLTSLTELQLQVETVHDISSVSECIGLQDLQLRSATVRQVSATDNVLRLQAAGWAAAEWDALLQLTRLTSLRVDIDFDDVADSHGSAYCDVLRQLPGLHAVGACTWTDKSLPVLQSLTSVTAVYGGWKVSREVDLSELVCPHVRELGGAFADVPFCAFPNITWLSCSSVSAACLSTIRHHCTGLQKLSVEVDLCLPYSEMFYYDGSATARMSAIKSLAHLPHLTHLELLTAHDAELMAFTSEAAAVGALQLRCLHVHGPMSVFALLQLSSVHGLNELHVKLSDLDCESFIEGSVRSWLVSLAVIPKVSLVLFTQQQRSVVEASREWAAQWELPLPALLKISVEPGCQVVL